MSQVIDITPKSLEQRLTDLMAMAHKLDTVKMAAHDAHNHGIVNGLRLACSIMTGDPPEYVERPPGGYIEEITANRNLGYEALKLLKHLTMCQIEDIDKTMIKAKQLIQVWEHNTEGEEAREEIRMPDPGYLKVEEGTWPVNNAQQLVACDHVSDAMVDRPGWEFRRLVLHKGKLCSEFVDPDELLKFGYVIIGDWTPGGQGINLPEVKDATINIIDQ